MPLRRTRVVHTSNGDATTTFNGTSAWYAAPLRPVDMLTLAGQGLAGAKIDAMLFYPTQVKSIAPRWQLGTPPTRR